jgi:hypothetical protein
MNVGWWSTNRLRLRSEGLPTKIALRVSVLDSDNVRDCVLAALYEVQGGSGIERDKAGMKWDELSDRNGPAQPGLGPDPNSRKLSAWVALTPRALKARSSADEGICSPDSGYAGRSL